MLTLEESLLGHFLHHYRRIWVQRSKLSIVLTLFPLNPNEKYQMIVRKECLKGMEQELDFCEIRSMIKEHLNLEHEI